MNQPVFLPIATDGVVTAGFACYPVVVYHNSQVERVIETADPAGGTSLQDYLARVEHNPARAAALARARQRMGNWMAKEMPDKGLAALRMQAGLSQAKLAELLGTQQSNISRWEKAPGDLQYSTIKKMAQAFGVATSVVTDAIDAANQAQGEAE